MNIRKLIILGLMIIFSLSWGMSERKKDIVQDTAPQQETATGCITCKHLPAEDVFGEKIIYDKKVYLIDVWATWCPPCRMTVPELVALQSEYQSQGFMVVGLSVDKNAAPLKPFIAEYKINYPVAMAGEALAYLPPVRGIPTMFLIDGEGKIHNMYVGYTAKEKIAADIEQLLN